MLSVDLLLGVCLGYVALLFALAFYVDNYDNNTTGKFEKAITEEGVTRVTFTPAQTAELNKLAASVREDWVKKYAGQFDSKKLFDFTAALFSE